MMIYIRALFDHFDRLPRAKGLIPFKSARIYEDVTPLRSRIMFQLRNKDDKKAFKYVWSRGLRIYARTHEEAAMEPQPKPHIISNPDDLLKLGFTEIEVENIIKGNNAH